MMRVLKPFLWLLLVFLIVLLTLTGWIYFSATGLQWAVNNSKPFLPENLQLGKVSGKLSETVSVDRIAWREETSRIELSNIQLDCNWLDFTVRHFKCTAIKLERLNLETIQSDSPAGPMNIQLPEVRLPITADINLIKVNAIELTTKANRDQSVKPQRLTSNVRLEQVSYFEHQVKLKQLTGIYSNAPYSVSLILDPFQDWQHQLRINYQWRDTDLSVQSSGGLKQQAKLSIETKGQFNSSMSGRLNLSPSIVIENGVWQVERQSLNPLLELFDVATLPTQPVVDNTHLAFSINWPQVSATLNSQWQDSEQTDVALALQLSVLDVINWSQQLEASLKVTGALDAKSLVEWSGGPLSESSTGKKTINDLGTQLSSKSKANIPVDIAISAKAVEQHFELSSSAIQIDSHRANVEAKGRLENGELQSLSSSMTLKIADLYALLGNSSGRGEVSASVSMHDARWSIASNGNIDRIIWHDIDLEKLKWELDLAQQLEATLSLSKFKFQQHQINETKIKLSGSSTEQRLKANGQYLQYPFSLAFDGARAKGQQNSLPLTLNNIQAHLEMPRSLNLSIQQAAIAATGISINKGCFSGVGEICFDANYQGQQWQSKGNIRELDFTQIAQGVEQLNLTVPVTVKGIMNGKFHVSGIDSKVNALDVDLTSPVIQVVDGPWRGQWNNFQASSDVKQDSYNLLLSWEKQQHEVKTPQWQSTITTANGLVKANVSQLDDMTFELNQPEIDIQLPHSVLVEDIEPGESSENSNITNEANETLPTLSLDSIKIAGARRGDAFTTDATFKFLQQDEMSAQVSGVWPIDMDSQLEGRININIKNFDWLKQWQSRIDELDIDWQHAMRLTGSLNDIDLSGSGELSVNRLVMEEIGLDIENSRLQLSSNKDVIKLVGNLRNKKGELKLNGEVDLLPELSAQAILIGEKIQVLDSPESKVVVSPELTAKFDNNHLSVQGEVVIDKAEIEVNSIPRKTISVSDDQIILGEKVNKEEQFGYTIDLLLKIGSDVAFKGFGLSSNLNGNLDLLAEQGQAIKLNGQLLLTNGKFEAYKQALTIEEGQLIFLGSAENPGIQFKATRQIDDIKVGVVANGTLIDPRLTLYSEPALPEENIVALLLTGRSIESLSQSEGNALANAAISLGVEGANKVAQKIGDALGIKNVQITSKSKADSSRVDIATQINDRLSVGYGTTIDSSNEMQAGWIIEYRLTPNLSFEAISGQEMSASISFKKQFESSTKKDKPAKQINDTKKN